MQPKVSFVIPCYKLAHLLPECIESILSQTYGNFEILIMDDCSPDNTPEVAQSFADPRVIHVRNEPNLGHLRNYNKGIEMARGEYIWLISADDRLRRNDALERYVSAMDANPTAGFAFCPGVGLQNGQETCVLGYSVQGSSDRLIQGHDLFLKLLQGNSILAAAGMVRRRTYEKAGSFPLDLPFSGDWYLWLLFSLHFDAVYIAEPLVNYRYHEMAMSNVLAQDDASICSRNDMVLLWRVYGYVEMLRDQDLLRHCTDALAAFYGDHLASKPYRGGARVSMTMKEFEASLAEHSVHVDDARIRSRAFAVAADRFYWAGQLSLAREFCGRALREDPWNASVWMKYLLLRAGRAGTYLRQCNIKLKQILSPSQRPRATSSGS